MRLQHEHRDSRYPASATRRASSRSVVLSPATCPSGVSGTATVHATPSPGSTASFSLLAWCVLSREPHGELARLDDLQHVERRGHPAGEPGGAQRLKNRLLRDFLGPATRRAP